MLRPSEAPALPLQEALRTIGNDLEARRAQQVRLAIDARGVKVDARGAQDGAWDWSWADLAARSRAQAAQRRTPSQPPWQDPWALTRWPVLLRTTGLLLDTQGVRECIIEATLGPNPETVALRVLVGEQEVLRRTEVGVQLWRLRAHHGPRAPAPVRPWWAPWRQ